LNPFDIAIIVVIAFCLIRGAFRGIIKEASSIVGVIAGVWAAYSYYVPFSRVIEKVGQIFPNPSYVDIISFLFIFVFVFAAVSALGILIKYLMKIVFLSWVDKVCGAGFGLVKGFMIVSVLLMILTAFLDPGTPIVKNSILSPYVSTASETMARFASKDMRHKFSSKMDVAKKSWKEKAGKMVNKKVTEEAVKTIKEKAEKVK